MRRILRTIMVLGMLIPVVLIVNITPASAASSHDNADDQAF